MYSNDYKGIAMAVSNIVVIVIVIVIETRVQLLIKTSIVTILDMEL